MLAFDGMASNIRHALSEAVRWLWQHIESFPIPIEDALWVQTYANLEATEHVSTLKAERVSRVQGVWEDPRHASNAAHHPT